ncbi:MAG: AAA family ATPase [Verrucomicrobiota bacterium]|nr:AAA family ATPase [Verrucomicrobiota bacterium]MCC6820132.1 AAA family ATPase [Limisphaerales bacterium]
MAISNQQSGHPDALGPVTEGVPKKLRSTRLSKPGVVEFAAPPKPEFSFNLKPADIAKHLNRFVIGQREAKKVLSVALCDHFQHVRMTLEGNAAPFYQKQNVLLLGPTGVGKTHLIRSAAELIGVPFVKADATKFSETGYVGGDVDDLVRDLLRRAGGDVKKAEHGIIYLDEVDKLATRGESGGRDVSGRGVQTNLLKLMEDGDVPVVSPNDMTGQLQSAMSAMRGSGAAQPETINTRHILFIVSGAFSGVDQIIKRRLASAVISLAKIERLNVDHIIAQIATSDLIAYGLEPEFIGRLPVRVACHGLDTDDLFDVLRKSESSLIHQYERAFAAYGIKCEFKDDGLRRLAELASTEHTGARGLMTVCERVFRDFKFKLPGSRVKRFAVSARLVAAPALELRRLTRSVC